MTNTITLTPEQSRAQDAVAAWLRDRSKPWFTIHGLAGTGKTSLARHFAAQQSGRVVYAAYTGKACDVLRKKGCSPVSTIHRLIYLPRADRNEELQRLQLELESCSDAAIERRLFRRIEELQTPKWCISHKSLLTGAALLILDECSMVNEPLARDLLSFGVPILVLGDPGQLPPIEGFGYFDAKPDFMLNEIHRQAAESPVIQLALKAREGRTLLAGNYGSSRVITRARVGLEEAIGVTQIVCGSNKARVALNIESRQLRRFSGIYPQKGERLICLRNNEKTGMLNGMMVDLTTDAGAPLPRDEFGEVIDLAQWEEDHGEPYVPVPIEECGPFVEFDTTEHGRFKAYKLNFTKPEAIRAMDFRKRAAADEFDWGWAITGHKAQGSQFESVLVYADLFKWDRDMFSRWLYTSITRAEDRVIVAL